MKPVLASSFWLSALVTVWTLMGLVGCSTTYMPPTTTVTPAPEELLENYQPDRCDSGMKRASANILLNKEPIDGEWGGATTRYKEQRGWLSMHLDLLTDTVQYAEPIRLRLVFTNTLNEPVVFARPQHISFYGDATLEPNQSSRLLVGMVSSAGERIKPVPIIATQLSYYPLPIEQFSHLAPGESCSLEIPLLWSNTHLPLSEPIPPGKYNLQAVSQHYDLGPQAPNDRAKMIDISAWVGETELSNNVTVTILPPVQ